MEQADAVKELKEAIKTVETKLKSGRYLYVLSIMFAMVMFFLCLCWFLSYSLLNLCFLQLFIFS